jgi:hypothetical protein
MSAAAIYARYSSDLQREASIEDQNRICRERAAKEGWSIYQEYSDSGISAASLIRPGIQKLLRDALDGRFAIILTESLDRLSRDQEDIAHIFKRITFAGGRIVTLSEGDINELHIGLKGTMGAARFIHRVDRIELSPVVRSGRKTLSVSLYGRLAGILAMATKAKAPLDESDASVLVTKLVAAVGFEPTTFRL